MNYIIKFVPNVEDMPVRYNVDKYTAVYDRDKAAVYQGKTELDKAFYYKEASPPVRYFDDQIDEWISYSTEIVEVG